MGCDIWELMTFCPGLGQIYDFSGGVLFFDIFPQKNYTHSNQCPECKETLLENSSDYNSTNLHIELR